MLTHTHSERTSSWLDSAVDLTPVIRRLIRRWYLVAAAGAIGAILGYGLSFTATPEFEASGTLYVLAPKTYELAPPDVNLGTFQSLLQNRTLIVGLIEEKGLDGAPYGLNRESFEDRLSVRPLRTSEMLRISFLLPNAELAADVVNTLADRAIALHREVSEGEESSLRASLGGQRGEAEARVQAAESRLRMFRKTPDGKGTPSRGVEEARLQADYELQTRVLQDVTLQYEQMRMRVASNIAQLQVVDRAVVPERPASPKRRVWTLIGGILGVLCGAILVAGRWWNDESGSHA